MSNPTESVAFHPPTVLGLLLATGAVLQVVVPLPFLPPTVPWVAGPIVLGLAIGVFAATVRTLSASNTHVSHAEPTTTIVDHGPFAWSRNPIYVAMVLLLVGVGLFANSSWFLGLAVVDFVALDRGVIPHEEAFLAEHFGERYAAYRAKVRRWL